MSRACHRCRVSVPCRPVTCSTCTLSNYNVCNIHARYSVFNANIQFGPHGYVGGRSLYRDRYPIVTSVSKYVSYCDLCIAMRIPLWPMYRGTYHIAKYYIVTRRKDYAETITTVICQSMYKKVNDLQQRDNSLASRNYDDTFIID